MTLPLLSSRTAGARGFTGLLALAFAFAAPAATAQVTFDTFDDGDVMDVGTFSDSGGGIGVGPTDDRNGMEASALSIGVNPADTGAFAGFVIPGGDGTTDVSGEEALTFYFRATSVQAGNLPLTLEINLHEDVNGNGTYEGDSEDEFQATYAVSVGTGYQFVSIPLSAFSDDNSVFAGANDGFDYSNLLEIVFAFGGPTGPEFAMAVDDFVFAESGTPTIGDITEFDFFNDGSVEGITTFSETSGGIGVGPTDDASGTADRAVNVGIDPSGTGTFAGVVFPGNATVTDVDGSIAFVFQVRPTVAADNLPLTLEINFHEDVNGNGTYEGDVEDEYQATYTITGASAFTEVVIPISQFTDDNSVFAGANDGFDYSNLLEVVIAISGPTGPGYAISFDELGFAAASTAGEALPEAFTAAPSVYPNPASGVATVAFELAEASDVSVDVVDLLGRRVATLASGAQAAGAVRMDIPTSTLAAGLYLVRVQTETGVAATRFTVVR